MKNMLKPFEPWSASEGRSLEEATSSKGVGEFCVELKQAGARLRLFGDRSHYSFFEVASKECCLVLKRYQWVAVVLAYQEDVKMEWGFFSDHLETSEGIVFFDVDKALLNLSSGSAAVLFDFVTLDFRLGALVSGKFVALDT